VGVALEDAVLDLVEVRGVQGLPGIVRPDGLGVIVRR
jgi:hypothetical protein